MNWIQKHKNQLIAGLLFIFYIVGAIHILIPEKRAFYLTFTPFVLLFSTLLLLLYHKKYTLKAILAFGGIFAMGLIVEIIGVQTGLIFGAYQYGATLGPKIIETPWMIGVNWLLLVYASASILSNITRLNWLRALLGAILMLGYDFLLEPVAVRTDMWTWEGGFIPIQNYIAWGIIAFAFHWFLARLSLSMKNKMALPVFISQVVYLLILQAL